MTTNTKPPERIENATQIIIMFTIGTMAAAASFTHVHDVAIAHGQPPWIGWADAVVVELMSIALGLELRRRARTRRPVTFIMIALIFFIAVSLAAQVVEAERSLIGWLAAALPALGFLVLAKVVLSRTVAKAANTKPETTPTTHIPKSTTHDSGSTTHGAGVIEPATKPETTSTIKPPPQIRTTPISIDSTPIPTHLLPTARFAVVNHEQTTGKTITVDELAVRMSINSQTAQQLLDHLNPRINGTPVTSTSLTSRENT